MEKDPVEKKPKSHRLAQFGAAGAATALAPGTGIGLTAASKLDDALMKRMPKLSKKVRNRTAGAAFLGAKGLTYAGTALGAAKAAKTIGQKLDERKARKEKAASAFLSKFASELEKRRSADNWGQAGATIAVAPHLIDLAVQGARVATHQQNKIVLHPVRAAKSGLTGYGAGRLAHRVLRGKVKESSLGENLGHGAEIAGLGVLARPTLKKWHKLKDPNTSPEEKSEMKHEIAGLGVLAVPSAIHLGHSAYHYGKGLLSKRASASVVNPGAFSGRAAVKMGLMGTMKAAPAAAPAAKTGLEKGIGAQDLLNKIRAAKAARSTTPIRPG